MIYPASTKADRKIKRNIMSLNPRQWDILCNLQGSDRPLSIERIAKKVSHHNTSASEKSFREMIARDLRDLKRITGAIESKKISLSLGPGRQDRIEYSWNARGSEVMIKSLSGSQALALGVLQKIGLGLVPPAIIDELKPIFSALHKQEIVKGQSDSDPETKITAKAVASVQNRWLQKIKLLSETVGFIPAKIKPSIEKLVYEALYQEKLIELTYRGKESVVKPLGLVQKGARRYLVAIKRYGEGQPSLFTMSLIDDVREVHSLEYNDVKGGEDFDLDEFFKKGLARPVFDPEALGKPIELEIWVDQGTFEWLSDTPIAEGQRSREVADGHVISVSTTLREELVYWILSMANHVRVIGPDILKQRIAEDLRKSLSLYD